MPLPWFSVGKQILTFMSSSKKSENIWEGFLQPQFSKKASFPNSPRGETTSMKRSAVGDSQKWRGSTPGSFHKGPLSKLLIVLIVAVICVCRRKFEDFEQCTTHAHDFGGAGEQASDPIGVPAPGNCCALSCRPGTLFSSCAGVRASTGLGRMFGGLALI